MSTHSDLSALLAAEASAAVPRISTAQLLNAPENAAIKALWLKQHDANALRGKRVAVIATDGVEEIEITTVLHALGAQGATVHVIAPRKPQPPAWYGLQMPVIRDTHILTIHYIEPGTWLPIDRFLGEVDAEGYDAVIIPGGTWNPDVIREDAHALAFVRHLHAAGKLVAAICHGPWVLSDAGVLRGKQGTSWWSMRADLENAGVTFLDQPVVVDGNVITSRSPMDLAHFVAAIETALA